MNEMTPEQKRAALERRKQKEAEQKKMLKKLKTKYFIRGYLAALLPWFVITAIIIAALSSGGSTKDDPGTDAGTPTQEEITENREQSIRDNAVQAGTAPQKPAGQIGSYVVTVKDSVVATSTYDGDVVLVVTYEFTNNSEAATSFDSAISDKAFQQGVELGDVFSRIGLEDVYDFESSSREIKPGVTIEVQEAYELNDLTSAVEIDIEEMWNFLSKETLTYTIEIAE